MKRKVFIRFFYLFIVSSIFFKKCQQHTKTRLLVLHFLMHPFSTPWTHLKTVRFSVFRGWRKGALGTNGLRCYHPKTILRTTIFLKVQSSVFHIRKKRPKISVNRFIHNDEKWSNILLKFCGVQTTRLLKCVWPFFIFNNRKIKVLPMQCWDWNLPWIHTAI